jgi:hypothetical protein
MPPSSGNNCRTRRCKTHTAERQTMNAVLYTNQLEPITVVDIPMWAWKWLAQGKCICLDVPEPPRFADCIFPPVCFQPKSVVIFGELIRRREDETLMLFTADEENALLLRAAFLPGQLGAVRNKERSAFAAGFLKALQEIRP